MAVLVHMMNNSNSNNSFETKNLWLRPQNLDTDVPKSQMLETSSKQAPATIKLSSQPLRSHIEPQRSHDIKERLHDDLKTSEGEDDDISNFTDSKMDRLKTRAIESLASDNTILTVNHSRSSHRGASHDNSQNSHDTEQEKVPTIASLASIVEPENEAGETSTPPQQTAAEELASETCIYKNEMHSAPVDITMISKAMDEPPLTPRSKKNAEGIFKLVNVLPVSPRRLEGCPNDTVASPDKTQIDRMKNRLVFAKYKLENGLQNQTLSEVEEKFRIESSKGAARDLIQKYQRQKELLLENQSDISNFKAFDEYPDARGKSQTENFGADGDADNSNTRLASNSNLYRTTKRKHDLFELPLNERSQQTSPINAHFNAQSPRSSIERKQWESFTEKVSRSDMFPAAGYAKNQLSMNVNRSDEEDVAALMLMLSSPRSDKNHVPQGAVTWRPGYPRLDVASQISNNSSQYSSQKIDDSGEETEPEEEIGPIPHPKKPRMRQSRPKKIIQSKQ